MRTITNIGIRHLAGTLLAVAALQACHATGSQGTYMVVDLATGSSTCETGVPADYTNDVYKTTKMVFRKVPAGTYAVQDGNVQATMTNDYYVGVYEVTAGQYKLMQDPETSVPATEANMKPKANVSYNTLRGTRDAAAEPTAASPLGKLTALVRAAGGSGLFDLPTEAMWEVAARAMPANDTSHDTWSWFFGTSASALGERPDRRQHPRPRRRASPRAAFRSSADHGMATCWRHSLEARVHDSCKRIERQRRQS